MPEGNATGGSQHPQAGEGTPSPVGQHPQAGEGQPKPTPNTGAQGTSAQHPQAGEEPIAPDVAREIKRENAALRRRIEAFEAAQKEAELAKLGDLEKAQKQLADLQAQHTELTRVAQERIVRAEVRAAASAVGIKPELAARLIDYAAIEYEDSGEPKNIGKLLEKLAADYPELAASGQQAGQQQRPAPSVGQPMAPARSAQVGTLTMEAIARMTPDEYAANYAAIQQFYRQSTKR